jgi:uncharacterized membrane protein YccC
MLRELDRSLAVLHTGGGAELERLAQLTERGEQISQLMLALDSDEARPWKDAAAERLHHVSTMMLHPRRQARVEPTAWPAARGTATERALRNAVDEAFALAAGLDVAAPSDERRTPSTMELVRDEFHWSSPILQHALRLAIVCIVGELVGIGVGAWLGADAVLTGHGFWVVLTIALVMTPDYGATTSKGIGRTIGSILGAAIGIVLMLSLPQNPVLHTVLIIVLYWGYLVFRSCGQPWTMLWVVAWIAVLTPGTLGPITRGLDTVIGAVLGLAAIIVFPTWQRKLLTPRLDTWAGSEADRLDALAALWNEDTEQHRLDVAHATVRSRMARLDFTDSAASAAAEPPTKHGGWDNDELTSAGADVVDLGRRIAALEALAPQWDEHENAAAASVATQLAQALRGLAEQQPLSGVAPGESVAADLDGDTRTAVTAACDSAHRLSELATAQRIEATTA